VKLWIERGQLCYRAPQGALSAADIVALRKMKGDILSLLRRKNAPFRGTPQAATWAPLTFQQEVYWNFFCSEDPTWNHFIAFALRLRGVLDIDVLHKAVNALTARHESLRTRLSPAAGTLMQEIDEPDKDTLKVLDLTASGCIDTNEQATRYLERLFRKRVDTSIGPTFEAHLLILADDEFVFWIGVHHALSDAMSISLLFRELWVLYDDFLLGRPASLPSVSMQYSDYASWQRATRPRWLEEHGGYWKRRLAGSFRLRLPTDSGLQNIRPFSPGILELSLDRTLSAALHNLARCERTSVALVLLAVYSGVSSSWCNQRDFVIPFNVTGRQCAEHANVMGLFFHSLLLRIEIDGNESFIELLHQVSLEFLTAHEHIDSGMLMRDVPHLFEGTILQCLSLQPDDLTGTSSLLPHGNDKSSFSIESIPEEMAVISDTHHLKSDIQIGCQETAQGIRVCALYRADLFTAHTMHAFLTDLRLFADWALTNPLASITSFQCLSPAKPTLLRFNGSG
jgi:hypothetical protein